MGCLIIFKPKVSIVIPAFKAEKHIEKTLASVIRQDQGLWELIVVEDGSLDQTEKICKKFQIQFPQKRIEYFRLPLCKGQGNARNQGIKKAQGEWIAFLDSDDLWPENYLSQMLSILEKENADVGYCSLQNFDSQTEKLGGIWGPTFDDLKVFPETLFLRNFINPSATICRKKLFDSVQFDPHPKVQSCEDHDLWLTLVSQGAQFVHVPNLKVLYRKNHEGAATGNRERMFLADIEVMKKQWTNSKFKITTKLQGLSQNYFLLAEERWKKYQKIEPLLYFKSWLYWPLNGKILKRLIKICLLERSLWRGRRLSEY